MSLQSDQDRLQVREVLNAAVCNQVGDVRFTTPLRARSQFDSDVFAKVSSDLKSHVLIHTVEFASSALSESEPTLQGTT